MELKRGINDDEIVVEREWVLPTHLREKWSLKAFAEIFDAIEEEPPPSDNDQSQTEDSHMTKIDNDKIHRTGGKRILLATTGDDSTIVYYIVHDGIVKPRQN